MNKCALLKRNRRGTRYFVFPGGGVDNGEIPEQAAVREAAEELGVQVTIQRLVAEVWGSIRKEPPKNYREVKECDTVRFGKFWKHMLDTGIFLPPSQFETNFLSTAHSDQDLITLMQAYIKCLSK